jgi:hypothetical protein
MACQRIAQLVDSTRGVQPSQNMCTQPEEVTRLQLQVYAAGYHKMSGRDADLGEIHNLEVGHVHREQVTESLIQQTLSRVVDAGNHIRDLKLSKREHWCPVFVPRAYGWDLSPKVSLCERIDNTDSCSSSLIYVDGQTSFRGRGFCSNG